MTWGELDNISMVWVMVFGLLLGIGFGFFRLVMTGFRERSNGTSFHEE